LFVNDGVPARLSFNSANGFDALIDLEVIVTDTGFFDGTYTLDDLTLFLQFDAPLDPTQELLSQETNIGPGPDFAINFTTDRGLLQDFDVNTFGAELRDPTDGSLLDRVWFRLVSMTPVAESDTDEDGVSDAMDNCTAVANADQFDADGDGFGNACDADFDQDCVVSFQDLATMRESFFGENPLTDLDSDGTTNFSDLGILRNAFFGVPGPSGTVAACN
ncbi:MAG: thrombospondin type 3 repeat-containing protein, partial [Pseudomonadota bacterium]